MSQGMKRLSWCLKNYCMDRGRDRRTSSATSSDGLIIMTSIDLPSLAGKDMNSIVREIEDTKERLKELESKLQVSPRIVVRASLII